MDFTENLKGFIFKAFIVLFSLGTFLWLSIFFYGLLYYLYIPAVAHVRPVNLQYDMSCYRREQCRPKFPCDNVTLIEDRSEFLRGSQGYAIELVLELPESELNWNQGIFMIKLDMINYDGGVIKSTRRAAMLRYRSPLFKTLYTLFFMPGLLAGSFEEKQFLVIPLFENYIADPYNPAHFAHVEIEAEAIQVYFSSLRIHAQFTGLRYLMYYWPVFSATVGIGGNFLFLVSTASLIWFYESTKMQGVEVNAEKSQRLTRLSPKNTDDFRSERGPIQVDEPRSDIENAETEKMPVQNEQRSNKDLQLEENVSGIERTINVENLPRQRSTRSQLQDDD